MNLTPKEQAFIDRRRKLLKAWPWAGGGALALLAALVTWLWIEVPMMINPLAAMEAVSSGAMEESTLLAMALMLPILVLAVMGVLGVMVTLMFVAMSHERRLIGMLDRIQRESQA